MAGSRSRSRSKSRSRSRSTRRSSRASSRASRKSSKKGRPKRRKRGLNPFMKFAKTERSKIKKQKPNLSVTQVAKELGRRWRKLSDEQKRKFGVKSGGGKSGGRKGKKRSRKRKRSSSEC